MKQSKNNRRARPPRFPLVLAALIGVAAGCQPDRDAVRPDAAPASAAGDTGASAGAHPAFLYGRVTLKEGGTVEGRIRFGGNQEAFWGDYFNGSRKGNAWADQVPEEAQEKGGIAVLGLRIGLGSGPDLDRQFMSRFGDIARIEARDGDLWVTLKNGEVFHLARYAADDFADGVRVWDAAGGVVDLGERDMRSIEFMAPSDSAMTGPRRLHGTVRTQAGDFTGFLEWDRTGNIGSDPIDGYVAGELVALRFDTIAAIQRESPDSSRVTLIDGGDLVLSGTRSIGEGNAGVFVDDARYGRVLIPWNVLDRVDFSTADSGPADRGPTYDDFPAGRPLTGTVTTRAGRSLAGRLVFDLDESEITETLDAPAGGVNYTIPFGLVSSILLAGQSSGPAMVILHNGEELRLERSGDLGDGNAGLLVFVDGREQPEYVRWSDVEVIEFDAPRAMYPPIPGPR